MGTSFPARRGCPFTTSGKQQPLVFDPLIGIIQDGVSVGLIEHEGRPHLQLIWAEIVAPMPEFETTLGGAGRTVSIELPELRLAAVRIDMTTGKVHPGVGGLEPPGDAKIDLAGGRVLLPLTRYVRRDGRADAVGWICAWIEQSPRDG